MHYEVDGPYYTPYRIIWTVTVKYLIMFLPKYSDSKNFAGEHNNIR